MRVAVSISVGTQDLVPQVREVLDVLKALEVEPVVVLADHEALDPKGCTLARAAAKEFPEHVRLAFSDSGSFSTAYLAGWAEGMRSGADFVVSMDADGSHDPQELSAFVEKFREGHKVVLSTRFVEGAENRYPFQRQIISVVGTHLANAFLSDNGTRLTDFTSGFEGLHRDVVSHILAAYPPERWVSVVHGPYHLQNTILRMCIMYAGHRICEIPIRYGARRKGKTLGLGYITSASVGFLRLVQEKRRLERAFKG